MKHILIAIAAVLLVGCGPSMSIHDAARDGNIEVVKQHLAAGVDVNAKGGWLGGTPLHLAAGKGHKEIVELLIAAGADVNAKADNGSTPLHFATTKEIAELLIANGADVNAMSGADGRTPLHHAAVGGHKEVAELLIAKGADVNAKSEIGTTPLYNAAYYGSTEVAELLIANGADVNLKDDYGRTPLKWAVRHKHTETADLLRKHGGKTKKELEAAEPVAETSQPEPSTVKAPEANSDKEKALELLFGTNSTITEKDEAFLSAAKKGKLDEVKSLLAEGVDVDCSDAFSCTGLFWASANNHKSIVEYLIEKGANLNAGAGVGGTPLARAAYEGHVEVVELLIAKGADVNAKDVSGGSPLDSADESVVDLLRKHGAK
jgi:ankyrin repeat protein